MPRPRLVAVGRIAAVLVMLGSVIDAVVELAQGQELVAFVVLVAAVLVTITLLLLATVLEQVAAVRRQVTDTATRTENVEGVAQALQVRMREQAADRR